MNERGRVESGLRRKYTQHIEIVYNVVCRSSIMRNLSPILYSMASTCYSPSLSLSPLVQSAYSLETSNHLRVACHDMGCDPQLKSSLYDIHHHIATAQYLEILCIPQISIIFSYSQPPLDTHPLPPSCCICIPCTSSYRMRYT